MDHKHIQPEMAAIEAEMIALRRRLHAHPELGFEEHATSDLVAGFLTTWGYRVTLGLGGTGVVGTLTRGPGKRLGLRADMDALPIRETTGLPHASRCDGVMHACGHDGHTAMLLAAARCLAERERFTGTLNLIFQPAEEGLGGAKRMIDDGLFAQFPCDAVFAMHNVPGLPAGATVGSVLGGLLGASRLPTEWTAPLDGRIATSLPGGEQRIPDLLTRTLALSRSLSPSEGHA